MQFNKLQGSGKNVRCIPLQYILFFHAAATSFSELSESSFVCFLARASWCGMFCWITIATRWFFRGSNPNPVLYLFDLGRPYFFVIGGSPISALGTCESGNKDASHNELKLPRVMHTSYYNKEYKLLRVMHTSCYTSCYTYQ